MNAQTRIWDFGNFSSTEPNAWTGPAAGVASGGAAETFERLTLVPHNSSANNFGLMESNSATFEDGYTSSYRFKFNGGGSPTDNMPTVRYLMFPVSGDCTIKMWFRSGGSSERTLYVTDGTKVLGEYTMADGSGAYIETISYTGDAANIYIYGSNSFNFSKLEVSGAGASTLGTKKFNTADVASVYTNANQVFVSNLKSETQVNVYSITGALVQSAKTASDVSFNLQSGVYIVKAQSAEGVKSVKVVVN